MERKPIGLTVPYREVGYKEKSGWVALTKEEREQIQEECYGKVPHHVALIAAVEAKLREKNEKKK